MRFSPILCAASLLLAGPAIAQVTVDLHALQALPNRPPATTPAQPRVVLQPRSAAQPPRELAPREPPTREPPTAAETPTPPAPAPAIPESIPDTASINPVSPPPSAAPPPAPPVASTSQTTTAPTTSGLRLSFAPGQSDLSPESSDSIKELVKAAPTDPAPTFNILAYAPGAPDDPSTARRTSLARAMAVRNALVADGVASARIFVRALGAQYGSGPPDRVDIDVASGNDAGSAR